MKKQTKAILVAACAALLVITSVLGTMAYLTDTSEPVVNTFIVGSIFVDPSDDDPEPGDKPGDDPTQPPVGPADKDPDDPTKILSFVLAETKATRQDDGTYANDPDGENTRQNTYRVLPGVDLPKEVYVRSTRKLDMDAYVFIEVLDKTAAGITAVVDTDNWTLLDVTPKTTGAKVYVIKANSGVVSEGAFLKKTTILKDNKVAVAADFDLDLTPGTLTFYGYMCQAGGFASATAAWNAVFAPAASGN